MQEVLIQIEIQNKNWVQLLTPFITIIGLRITYRNLRTRIENSNGILAATF